MSNSKVHRHIIYKVQELLLSTEKLNILRQLLQNFMTTNMIFLHCYTNCTKPLHGWLDPLAGTAAENWFICSSNILQHNRSYCVGMFTRTHLHVQII
jgi:hypothetical protein